MSVVKFSHAFIAVMLLVSPQWAQASNFSEQILAEAKISLGKQFSEILLEHSPLDSDLANCAKLQYHPTQTLTLGRQYINLSGCDLNKRLSITLSALVAMPIANSNISKNTVLNNEHFTVKQIKVRKKLKYFVAFDALIGRTTSKQIYKGKWLTEKSLKKDYLVERGSLISFRIEQHGFVVTTEMLAQDSGLLGQVIRVRHPISRKKLTATVTGKNQVSAINR